jgi:hypothetical protein
MEVNPQTIIEDLLEQNKQLTLQLSFARAAIAQLQDVVKTLNDHQTEQAEDQEKKK